MNPYLKLSWLWVPHGLSKTQFFTFYFNYSFDIHRPVNHKSSLVVCDFKTLFLVSYNLASFRWDFCYLKGRVIEHIDGHSDIVHKHFHKFWLSSYEIAHP